MCKCNRTTIFDLLLKRGRTESDEVITLPNLTMDSTVLENLLDIACAIISATLFDAPITLVGPDSFVSRNSNHFFYIIFNCCFEYIISPNYIIFYSLYYILFVASTIGTCLLCSSMIKV